MAIRILASRLVQNGSANRLPMRVCTNSMSSSTPAPTSPKTPAKPAGSNKPKRESLRSLLATFFGGYLDPADPNDPPIPVTKIQFPDITEHATGEEKLFLLAFENGIIDPYCTMAQERGDKGKTMADPIIVESFDEDRLVACACEAPQNHHKYTYVIKGETKRCQCGYWIKCVDAPRFWEKIPKEDLVDIAFFRNLEEDGKLDEFLKTGKLEDHYPKLGQAY